MRYEKMENVKKKEVHNLKLVRSSRNPRKKGGIITKHF